MGKTFSSNELKILSSMITERGHILYSSNIEDEYFQRTGVHRSGGSLYMAAWRLENGYYDGKFAA